MNTVSVSGRGSASFGHFSTVARRVAGSDANLVGVGRYAEFQPMVARAQNGTWIVATSDSFDIRLISKSTQSAARFIGRGQRQSFPRAERDSVIAATLKGFGKYASEYRGYVEDRLVGLRDSLQLLRRIRYAGKKLYAERFRACTDRSQWLVLDTLSRSVENLTLPSDADIIESPGATLLVTWTDTVGTHLARASGLRP